MKRNDSIALVLIVTLFPVAVFAAEPKSRSHLANSKKLRRAMASLPGALPARLESSDEGSLDFFQARDAGHIDVRFIPLDASQANLLIVNKTDRFLHVRLPEVFAAIPILAQLGPPQRGRPGGPQGQPGGGGRGAASQGVGGGVGGGANAGGNQGMQRGNQNGNGLFRGAMGAGFMRIGPGKNRKLTATTVCLEHGKAEPQPRLAYRMIPMDQFSKDERIASLCRRLGQGKIPQNTAQAAAWHLTDHLSWETLATINQIESRYLGNIKRFESRELQAAKEVIQAIETTPWRASGNQSGYRTAEHPPGR